MNAIEIYENAIKMYEINGEITLGEFEDMIKPLEDVAPVVRCKDCENWDTLWVSSIFKENAHRCAVLDNVFDEDFYCACGHKRRSF